VGDGDHDQGDKAPEPVAATERASLFVAEWDASNAREDHRPGVPLRRGWPAELWNSMLVRIFLYTHKAGPAGGLRPPSSGMQNPPEANRSQ
jgi:hypothetical protein